MVNEMVSGIGDTLKHLEKVAKKYEILGSNSKRRQIWAKLKWSVEFSTIDALRNKVGASSPPILLTLIVQWLSTRQLIYHNTVMNLLLTSVGK